MMFPDFYKSAQVGTIYQPDVSQAVASGIQTGITAATEDKQRTALLLIDAQVDFIHTDGALSVPGAVDDARRTIEWLFNNLDGITTIFASLDSHVPLQIFSPSWWVDRDGQPPAPFTVISDADVQSGVWQPLYEVDWSKEYTQRLEENAKKQLMIWPYHTLIGTLGHSITPALYETIAYHSAARQTQPRLFQKGTIAATEHYSLFEPEVKLSDDESSVNTALMDELGQYDRIYVAGQAKSHCVLESVTSLMRYFDGQPEVIRKLHLLEDTMSSVANPEIDFEALANSVYDRFEKHGLQRTNTSTTIK